MLEVPSASSSPLFSSSSASSLISVSPSSLTRKRFQGMTLSMTLSSKSSRCGEIFKGNNCEDEALINKKLPKELLLRIFSYLDVVSLCRCAQVSKSWTVLALDGSNWQRVDLFDFQTDVEGLVVENISRRCGGFLKKLSLRGCKSVTDSALKTFAQNCRGIEDLCLENCHQLSDTTCQSLSENCRKLVNLSLSSLRITDLSLKALGEGCPQLSAINLSFNEQITPQGVEQLAKGCRKIRIFTAKMCPKISDEAIIPLAIHCDLTVVNLHGCSNLTDDSVVSIATHCPGLVYLCISGLIQLTDTSLVTIGQYCPSLKTLEAAGVSQLTDTGLMALAKGCRYLSKLDLEECILITDSTLSYLATNCPNLETLILSHCELVTDEGIKYLTSIYHSNLTVVELDNCPLITDESLDHLVSCASLQRIELYDCQLITRAGIRKLRTHLPDLKVHAYFAPVTPPPSAGGGRTRYCRCCVIL